MPDEKLESLAPDEWFSDGSDEQYWTSGIGQVMRSERRVAGERHHVQVKVTVEPGSLGGTVDDISLGGALVYVYPPLAQGTYVELTLQTDRGMAKVGGVVRWRLKRSADSSPSHRVGMGIEFTWISLQMKELLSSHNTNLPY